MKTNKFRDIPKALDALSGEISRRITDIYRLEHTFSVARECLAIADILGFSESEAISLCTAALLHDIAKGLTPEQYASLDERYSIGFTDDDIASPAVLHAKAGAKIAEKEFAYCTDSSICRAIAQHTTGASGMSLSAKILFIADYVEPTRRWEVCKATRRILYDSLSEKNADKYRVLDSVMLRILTQTQEHLTESGKKVHPDAIKCKEFILKALE